MPITEFPGAGEGHDVFGPNTATDDAVATFNGTSGALIQSSPVTIDELGNVVGVRRITGTSSPATMIIENTDGSGTVQLGEDAADTTDIVGTLRFPDLSNDGELLRLDTTNGIAVEPSGFTVASFALAAVDGLWCPPHAHAGNITTVTAMVSTLSYAVYIGRVHKAYTSCTLQCRVTTAAATITWAEVAIASGTFNIAGNQTLTRRGSTSVAATFNSTGLKSTAITLTGVTAGMDLYALFGSSATTAFQCRGYLADDISTGGNSVANAQPSTMGAGTTFLVDAAGVYPWCAAIFT